MSLGIGAGLDAQLGQWFWPVWPVWAVWLSGLCDGRLCAWHGGTCVRLHGAPPLAGQSAPYGARSGPWPRALAGSTVRPSRKASAFRADRAAWRPECARRRPRSRGRRKQAAACGEPPGRRHRGRLGAAEGAPRPSRRHAHSLRTGSVPEDRAAASQTQAAACALPHADAGVAGAGPGSAPQEAPWLAAPGSHKPSGIPVTCFGKALPAFPRQLARSPGRTVQPLRSGVLSSLSCASCLLGRCWLLCWPGSLQGEILQGGQVCRRWRLCRFGSFRSSWLPCRMALSRLRFAFLQDMAARRWTRPRRGSGPCPAGSLKAAACCPLWGRLARSCPRSPQAGQTR